MHQVGLAHAHSAVDEQRIVVTATAMLATAWAAA